MLVNPRRAHAGGVDHFENRVNAKVVARVHRNAALARVERQFGRVNPSGVTYTQAFTAKPSDSFPGLMSIVTGGSPISTGIWYEGTYARLLSPPGSNCATKGVEVIWDDSVDRNKKLLDHSLDLFPQQDAQLRTQHVALSAGGDGEEISQPVSERSAAPGGFRRHSFRAPPP